MLALVPLTVGAVIATPSDYNFEVNGIYYRITSNTTVETIWKSRVTSGLGSIKYTKYIEGDVVIPENVTNNGTTFQVTAIGANTFNGQDITNYTLPTSVTNIGSLAFASTLLETVTVPTSVETLAGDAFHNTPWERAQPEMAPIYIGSFLYWYKSTDPNIDLSQIDFTIPEGITGICTGAMQGRCMKSVMFPSSLRRIDSYAFSGDYNTEFGSLPDGLQYVGLEAFDGCQKLNWDEFPASVTYIGKDAFKGTKWYDIQPDGPLYLNTLAYGYKGNIPSGATLNIPEGITTICDDAFATEYWRGYFESVTLPQSLTTIGAEAFMNQEKVAQIVLPSALASIGNRALYGCKGLIAVDVPASCQTIGNYAFYGSGVTTATIGGGAIGEGCFQGSPLKSVTLSPGVTSIGAMAFIQCPLESIEIPESVTSLGREVFDGCSQLTHLVLSPNIPAIEYRTFMDCTGLTEVTIPNGVEYINEEAFHRCENIVTLKIGANIKVIGPRAFFGTQALKQVYVAAAVPPQIDDYAFGTNTPRTAPAITRAAISGVEVFVPESVTAAYETSPEWTALGTITPIPDEEMEQLFAGGSSGITSISNDNAHNAAHFYDLSGRAVSVPTSGIYIKKHGNQTRKIIIH